MKKISAGKKAAILVGLCLAAAVLIGAAIFTAAVFGAAAPARTIPTLTPEHYQMEYDSIRFSLEDGQSLSGWLIPAENGLSDKTVIFSHDRGSNREIPEADGFFIMRTLVQSGYNVITFDYLGAGVSDGNFCTFGAAEAEQLRQVTEQVCREIPQTKIAILGWGCGAAAAIETAKDPRVLGVIAESCYETFGKDDFAGYFSLPFAGAGMAATKAVAGGNLALSPAETLKEIEGKHFYFIHCLDDSKTDYAQSQTLNRTAAEKNQSNLWLIEGGEHNLGALTDEENYPGHILEFLNEFMNET